MKRGFSQKDIAFDIQASQSTISRELKRNKGKRGYRFKQAQGFADYRRKKASSSPRKMTPAFTCLLEQKLQQQWSPEQISGRMRIELGIKISHEAIYRHIWHDKKRGGTLYKHLRRAGKKYNKRGNKLAGRGLIPDRVGIEYRPDIVDKKERIGDFEVDTIIGHIIKAA